MESHADSQPPTELVFRAATLKDLFREAGFGILVLAFLIPAGVMTALAFWIGNPVQMITVLIMVGLAAAGMAAVLVPLAQRSRRVVLTRDALIEYNGLNQVRTFPYDQIYAVRRGSHQGVLSLYFYPRSKNGAVDFKRARRTSLLTLQEPDIFQRELARRIQAPTPPSDPQGTQIQLVILLVILILAAALMLMASGLGWM